MSRTKYDEHYRGERFSTGVVYFGETEDMMLELGRRVVAAMGLIERHVSLIHPATLAALKERV